MLLRETRALQSAAVNITQCGSLSEDGPFCCRCLILQQCLPKTRRLKARRPASPCWVPTWELINALPVLKSLARTNCGILLLHLHDPRALRVLSRRLLRGLSPGLVPTCCRRQSQSFWPRTKSSNLVKALLNTVSSPCIATRSLRTLSLKTHGRYSVKCYHRSRLLASNSCEPISP